MTDVEIIEVKHIQSQARGHAAASPFAAPEVTATPTIERGFIPYKKVGLSQTYTFQTTNPFGNSPDFDWELLIDNDPNNFMELYPYYGEHSVFPGHKFVLRKPGYYLVLARCGLYRTAANWAGDPTKLIQQLNVSLFSAGIPGSNTVQTSGNSAGGSLLIDERSFGEGNSGGSTVSCVALTRVTNSLNPVVADMGISISAGGGNYPDWTFVPDAATNYISAAFLGLSPDVGNLFYKAQLEG